ncbi:MAG TPA: hypothetical protein VKG80_00910 [Trebonia sp.]|nr:hypothetical protein [Trebonia sp.]
MPLRGDPPAGRAGRLGLAPPPAGSSRAEQLPSPIVHGGSRHAIGGELAGNWRGRPAIVFDLDLATDYGSRGDGDGGVVHKRFHVAALGVRWSFPWYAVTRQDIREHLQWAGKGTSAPGTGRLDSIRLLAPGDWAPPPASVLDWAGRDVMARRVGRDKVSAVELAGPWALAAVPVAGMERSDEDAAALAAKLRKPEIGPWPEQLLGLLAELAVRLEAATATLGVREVADSRQHVVTHDPPRCRRARLFPPDHGEVIVEAGGIAIGQKVLRQAAVQSMIAKTFTYHGAYFLSR